MDLRHAALEMDPAADLLVDARSQLSDRHRLGVVLQYAALLAHARRAGLRLRSGAWHGATITQELRLCGLTVSREPAEEFLAVQNELRRFLLWLFGVEARIAGRGQARKIARGLAGSWQQSLTDLGPRRCVRQILRRSPFLWQRGFEVHRLALLATRDEGRVWQIVGPPSWRRNLLAEVDDADAARSLIGSARARAIWTAPTDLGDLDASQLFERGHWRAAVLRWRDDRPSSRSEQLLEARAQYAIGKFSTVLDRLRGRQDLWATMYRVASHHHLGDLHRAVRGLLALEKTIDGEGQRERLALAEVALRVLHRRGDEQRSADWVARCLSGAQGRWRGQAHLLAAIGEYDRGRFERSERHLRTARSAGVDEENSWRILHTEALLLRRQGLAEEAAARLEVALRFHRRTLRVFEAGRLWNDLAIHRWNSGRRTAAERAIGHAHRLLERCDGPLARDLTLSNLAEMRIRSGRLEGVEALLESSRAHSRAQGNLAAQAHDEVIRARWLCAQGRWEEALSALAAAEEMDVSALEPGELHALRCLVHALRGQGTLATHAAQRIDGWSREWLELEEAPLIGWLLSDEEAFEEHCGVSPAGECWRSLARFAREGSGREQLREQLWDLWQEGSSERVARWILLAERLSPGALSPSQLERAAQHFEGRGLLRLADPLRSGMVTRSSTNQRSERLWPALERLLDRPPGNEAELRLWFELLPLEDLSVERRVDGRRLVLLRRPSEADSCSAGAWSWRADGELTSAIGTALRLVDRCCPWLDGPMAVASLPPTGTVGLPDGWIGQSNALAEVADRLARLGRSSLPVLILGETGTGKELAAHWVHRSSDRSDGPFLPLNCAAVTETVLLSELFGHARGAFTGADRDHKGLFESAHGGTIFLDEIGDLPAAAQGMLLRVLQEGEVRRVGDNRPRPIDTRVVAATHRDLASMVESGAFREDLLYRLNVGQVELPPLRERPEDVLPLARHFLARVAPSCELSEAAQSALAVHSWPGNVREVKGTIERAAALRAESTSQLAAEDLGLSARSQVSSSLHEWLEQLKRQRVFETLKRCDGNQSRAARELGITRQAMSYLVRQLK